MSSNNNTIPEIKSLAEKCIASSAIDPSLYERYNVKRGLRDISGSGVLTGLTHISNIVAFDLQNGEKTPCEGKLEYRGIDIRDLTDGFLYDGRFGFEETTYLLLFGKLPTVKELGDFCALLNDLRTLPRNFVRDVIMKAPSKDMMNTLSRGVLTLSSYDKYADDVSLENVLRQCLKLIAVFPMLSVYGYHAYNHYLKDKSFYIHRPIERLSTAENILQMLRPNRQYTHLEAVILDLALVLHMEHGGGNNSTFTTRVVSSSGTDTYSAITAALGSLKGPKHGGANIKVVQMFEDLKKQVKNAEDEKEVTDYLQKLLNKEVFDQQGLIYGMGHAVYSISDPRAEIFKRLVEQFAAEKGSLKEYRLYNMVERIATNIIREERKIYKGVSANVDFYSGLVYRLLGLPLELFTPIFAMARIVGWSAHRMEELINGGKIIRPAYMNIQNSVPYVALKDR